MNQSQGWIVLMVFLAGIPAQAQGDRNVQDILEGIKRRADGIGQDRAGKARELWQQAQQARKEGKLTEAATLIQRAQTLAPDSEEIRQTQREILAAQRAQRERSVNRSVARVRLDEALALAERHFAEGRSGEARKWAQAVLAAIDRFPPDANVADARSDATKLLRSTAAPASEPAEQPAEAIPAPQPAGAKPMPIDAGPSAPAPEPQSARDSLRAALAQPLDVDWRNVPLSTALADLGKACKVPIHVDPVYEASTPGRTILNLRFSGVSADQILKRLTEITGAGCIVTADRVVFTTRSRAFAYLVARQKDLPEASSLLPVAPPSEPRVLAPRKLSPPPPLAAYLQSPEAFLEHIDELLGR